MENKKDIKFANQIIKEVSISDEMKKSFLSYAMSVIVSRALPDIKDGLKPVQRRIIYGMEQLNVKAGTAYKKSARIVGDVMGKYHPHGESSIYETMVRMAQPFSYRNPLVDGHGNFGSVDGDNAAAMRYTEVRMSKIAMEMVRDLDKETVLFVDNYDASEREPKLLPARFPNLLVNGSTGIAVGMATNIPPHNLGEVIDGIIAYIKKNDITTDELMQYIKGPDFPTGGQILGLSGLRQAYLTGNGKIVIRSKVEIQRTASKKPILIITEIPYQVNKTRLIERIAEIVKDKKVDGITDLRDESNRNGMRLIIELRKDVEPEVMLNNLYKHTQLQESFGINMIALVDDIPKTITLIDAIKHYYQFQIEIIQKRTIYDLNKAKKSLHLYNGYVKILNELDKTLEIIKTSLNGDAARDALIAYFKIDEVQAKAILDMRLQRITGMEISKIIQEAKELENRVLEFESIINSDEIKQNILINELTDIKTRFYDERRSELNLADDLDIEDEDLIPVEDIVVTLTNNGYVKKMFIDAYKTQNRGGVGAQGIRMHDDDDVSILHKTSTHDFHLFFTNKGRVFKIKGYNLPTGSKQSKGLPAQQLFKLLDNEKITYFTSYQNFNDYEASLIFVTKRGVVKKTNLSNFQNIRSNGIIAISLTENDDLITVIPVKGKSEILIGASNGRAIRFNSDDIRASGRNTIGVRGIKLRGQDEVVGATVVTSEEQEILVLTANGYGKRSLASLYRQIKRGGIGVYTINATVKTGPLCVIKTVNSDNDDLLITTNEGINLRTPISKISKTSRKTQGVIVQKLSEGQKIVAAAILPPAKQEDLETISITQQTIELENNEDIKTVNLSTITKEEEKNPQYSKLIGNENKE